MVERAPKELMGGNSRFTAGAFRCVYDGVDDLKAIMPDLTKDEIDRSDFGTYTQDQFYDDMFRVTQYRTDGELCDRLVGRSRDAMRWLHGKGMKFDPIWGRQAYLIDGKFKFWGGLTVESKGGGPGLIEQHLKLADKNGIEVRYNTRGLSLIYDGKTVSGLKVKANGNFEDIPCKSVVIACGGFESNAEMRTRYLGPGWELAKVRGTPYNTGDGINMALAIGASSFGNWSGSHAVQWDYNAPEFGDLSVGDNFQKHSLSLGHPDQRHRAALRRRGRRLPQLHLCEVRRDRAAPAEQLRLAGVRRQDRADAARRVSHQARVEGLGQHHRGVRPQARGR